jgi:hypothetical protein
MRRNSGTIGKLIKTSLSAASGIFDTFDNFNSRKNNSWPLVVKYTSTDFNSGTIYENTQQSITLYSEGVTSSTTLYWEVVHGTSISADFVSSSGTFTQSSSTNTGIFSFITSFTGNTSKTSKTFQIRIRKDNSSGEVVYTTGTYTIPAVTVSSLYFSSSPINEGSTTYLYLQLGNCGSYGPYNLTMNNSGTATSSDFIGGLPTSWYINPALLYSLGYTPAADITTEGTETLTVQLSYNGFNIGSAQTITINDTSTTPTGSILPSTTNVTEGDSITFTCTISGSYSGTAYYTVNNVSGTMSGSDFADSALSGSFTVTSGSGSFSKTLVSDGLSESESFSVSLRLNSTSGTIIATTATITVTDASAPSLLLITSTGAGSTVVPSGKTSAKLEAWGAGGGSMGGDNNQGSGAGGAYASVTFNVTAGSTIYYNVGAGGIGGSTSGGTGGDSWVNISTNSVPGSSSQGCKAVGGLGAPTSKPNNSGQSSSCIGTTIYIGGSGAATGPESGGGGAASSLGNGQQGISGNGTNGGNAGTGGGLGGTGGGTSYAGQDGVSSVEGGGGGGGSYNYRGGNGGAPGGAGGMGWSSGGTVISGGNNSGVNTNNHGGGGDGARGQVRITYN